MFASYESDHKKLSMLNLGERKFEKKNPRKFCEILFELWTCPLPLKPPDYVHGDVAISDLSISAQTLWQLLYL